MVCWDSWEYTCSDSYCFSYSILCRCIAYSIDITLLDLLKHGFYYSLYISSNLKPEKRNLVKYVITHMKVSKIEFMYLLLMDKSTDNNEEIMKS